MNASKKTLISFALWCLWCGVAAWFWLGPRVDLFAAWGEVARGVVAALWFWMLVTVLGWGIARRWFLAEPADSSGPRADATVSELATQLLVAAGIGLGVYAAIVLAFGIFVGVNRLLFLALHAGLAVWGGRQWLTVGRQLARLVSGLRARVWTRGEMAGLLLLLFALGSTLPWALIPNLNADTLRYHFGLTRLYETAGAIRPMPDFAEANTSLNWQMLYLGILVVAGETAAQVFNWAVFPLALVAVALASGPRSRGLASGVLAGTPFLLAETAIANNDLGVVYFCAVMWLAAFSGAIRRGWLLAGLLGGLALGTKYPSLLAVVGLAAGWLLGGTGTARERMRGLGGLAVGMAVGYAPWLIRNLWWTGDPVYPSLSRWLPWTGESGRWVVEHYSRELATYGAGRTGWARLVLAPWRVTMGDELYFESELGLVVWAVIPLVLWGGFKTGRGRVTAIASAVFGLLWAGGPQVTRFLAAGMPALVLAAAEGWSHLHSRGLRRSMAAVLGMLLAANLWVAWLVLAQMGNPFAFFLNRSSRDAYLIERSASYRMAFWINHHARPDERVLLIGVDDNWFFPNLARVSGPFDRKWIVDQANASRSPGELAERLRSSGIHLICIDRRRIGKLDRRLGYMEGLQEGSGRRLREFLDESTREVRRDGDLELRRLGPP